MIIITTQPERINEPDFNDFQAIQNDIDNMLIMRPTQAVNRFVKHLYVYKSDRKLLHEYINALSKFPDHVTINIDYDDNLTLIVHHPGGTIEYQISLSEQSYNEIFILQQDI